MSVFLQKDIFDRNELYLLTVTAKSINRSVLLKELSTSSVLEREWMIWDVDLSLKTTPLFDNTHILLKKLTSTPYKA